MPRNSSRNKIHPGNSRGIAPLNTARKVFRKLLNDRIAGVLEKESRITRVIQDSDAIEVP